MLLAGGAAPRSIAAITFTELAAGELRQRIAHYLDALLSGAVPDELRLCIPSKLKGGAAQISGEGERAPGRTDLLDDTRILPRPAADVLRRGDDRSGRRNSRSRSGRFHIRCDLRSLVARSARRAPSGRRSDHGGGAKGSDRSRETPARFRQVEAAPPECPTSFARSGCRRSPRFRRKRSRVPPLVRPASGDRATPKATSPISKRWPRTSNAASCRGSRLRAVVGRGAPRDVAPHAIQIVRSTRIQAPDDLEARQGGRRRWTSLADQAEENYARCREAYGTLMGRIATAIVSVFSSELDGLLSEYDAFKRRAAVMDFDDLLFTCREVLRRYPEVRAPPPASTSRA